MLKYFLLFLDFPQRKSNSIFSKYFYFLFLFVDGCSMYSGGNC